MNIKLTSDLRANGKKINLNKFIGNWYEIARLPSWFENGVYDAIAHYNVEDVNDSYATDEEDPIYSETSNFVERGMTIVVVNGGKRFGREITPRLGTARIKDANNTLLKVSFVSTCFDCCLGPNYKILAYEENEDTYTSLLVGTPSRDYLWILSRTSSLNDDIAYNYLYYAESQGYNLGIGFERVLWNILLRQKAMAALREMAPYLE